MLNYKLTLCYDGSAYHGWAKQPNNITIQETLERVLSKIFDQPINCIASGRTDAFVHAIEQVVNFQSKKEMDVEKLQHSINSMINDDICVSKIEMVDPKFHSQFSAKNKTYLYKIYTGQKERIFLNKYTLLYDLPIKISKLKAVAKKMLGIHDFVSFSISDLDSTIRTINWIKIKKKKDFILIYINGNGFLRAMVRMMVGNMLAYNEDKIKLETIDDLFKNPFKGKSIHKARASGLYLYKVNY